MIEPIAAVVLVIGLAYAGVLLAFQALGGLGE